jgi:hypothetical protein
VILNNPKPRGSQPKNIKKGTTQPSATIKRKKPSQITQTNRQRKLSETSENGKRTNAHVIISSPMTIGQQSFHSSIQFIYQHLGNCSFDVAEISSTIITFKNALFRSLITIRTSILYQGLKPQISHKTMTN